MADRSLGTSSLNAFIATVASEGTQADQVKDPCLSMEAVVGVTFQHSSYLLVKDQEH